MRLHKCWFCSATIYPGHGISFVRNDATMFRFCSSKCHKNFKMKRNPRKVKWTKAFRKARGKELAVDSTFDFERKRNRPVRYNRELVSAALKAIKRVDQIRAARKKAFYKKRMDAVKSMQRKAEETEIRTNISLIAPQGTADLSVEEMAQTVTRTVAERKARSTRVIASARRKAGAANMSESDSDSEAN
ncbi:ribosome biogenesis protein RLP24 [Thecamonas trahens ATCC 50062]|uniref:Ribosome biogenesis protein RLP24 n=1 Tax=Thecamonas trahens ATCC 50062 TaxID=461836 RepID=A0A0L0DQD0_THETB|nr:ribosome biogenesis protein RLP24 [Thecamonas trahens ATCC 50062]KNC53608.1 ribosome biogenesis protein RLP24 [Thecamonas trahens ATCC 50062]|eukprot:XP_013761925.1 ribosome biogenesis protein RLP24 [Thecamonas trahens ATCC 50062]